MRRPWNIINAPVYSLATYAGGRVNMNICSYVTAISMNPKIYVIGIYYNTKTLENLEREDKAVLQILNIKNTELVRPLGKKSGKKVDKHSFLERKGKLFNWKGYPVLKDANAYMELNVSDRKNITGDHELFLCEVRQYQTFSEDNILMYQDLIRQGIIL